MLGHRNESIQTLSLGYYNTGLLYQEGYVVVFGLNRMGQCDVNEVRNESIQSLSLGYSHTALLYSEG